MLYRDIIAVCSQIHTKHINTLCEQNAEFVNIKFHGTYCNFSRSEDSRGVRRVLVGKPEGKRPLGRHRCRWEDNIQMDFRKWDVKARIGLMGLRTGTGGGHL
jgi:hypothetical protein